MVYNNYSFKTGSDVSIFSTSSKGGYFFAKNFVVGTDLGYTRVSGSGTGTVTVIGGFARYYLPKNIFFGAGVNSARPHRVTDLWIQTYNDNSLNSNCPIVYIKGVKKGGIIT